MTDGARGGFPDLQPITPPPGFGRFLAAMRRAQDLAVSADPDDATWDEAADQVDRLVELLTPFEADEGWGLRAGRRRCRAWGAC